MAGNINTWHQKSLEMNHMTEKLMFFHLPLFFIKLINNKKITCYQLNNLVAHENNRQLYNQQIKNSI